MTGLARAAAMLAAALVLVAAPVLAEDAPARPWTDVAEVGVILTTGNSEVESLTAANKFVFTWKNADLTVDATALRARNKTATYSNIGGVLVVNDDTTTTAESYLLSGKYRQTIREGFLWYTQAGWTRNRFIGIDGRYFAGAGVGYRFLKDEQDTLVGELGANYNRDSYLAGVSPANTTFAEARAFLGYERRFGASSKFTNELEILENLKTTRDLRVKNVAAVLASLTTKLALKVSLTAQYDNDPVVKVLSAPGFPDVSYPYKKLDTMLTASLVINF